MRKPLFVAVVLLTALLSRPSLAEGLADQIFASGVEAGLAIHGRAFYPDPLSGAIVQARFGTRVATTATRTDGSYGLLLEHRYLDPDDVVEVIAYGRGAQAHLVWAAVLGPVERVIAAAGSDAVLDYDEEAFVHLSPRSTAVTAAMRADNGYARITDAASFDRTLRARPVYVGELTQALALIARGDLSLPVGIDDTWQALANLTNTQRLYADFRAVRDLQNCSNAPATPYCEVAATLTLDPQIYPAIPPQPAEIHSTTAGYQYCCGGTTRAFRVDASAGVGAYTAGADGAPMQPVLATVEGNGIHRIERSDQGSLGIEFALTVYINGQPVRRELHVLRERVRFTRGPGGLIEFAMATDQRWHHPNNPEIPDQDVPGRWGMPRVSSANRLPVSQQADLGPLSQRRVLFKTPFTASDHYVAQNAAARAADVHAFQIGTGTAERLQEPFTLLSQSADRFELLYGSIHSTVRLLNQDLPGVWRILVEIDEPDGLRILGSGLLLVVDEPQLSWTLVNTPGTYYPTTNGHVCDGPYGEIDALLPTPFCGPPRFGFQLDPGGTGVQLGNPGTPPAVEWLLPGGANQGRLRVDRWAPGPTLFSSRGWEIVKHTGDRIWVIENFETHDGFNPPPAPASFGPAHRVIPLLLP